MQISKTGLEKFKKLYTERFKENLSEADTLRKAQKLLNIFEATYGNPLAVDEEDIELQTNKQNKYEETKKEK